MTPQSLFAVVLNTSDSTLPDDFWVEFYWAEDADHAEEQALQQIRKVAIVCVALVPDEYTTLPER